MVTILGIKKSILYGIVSGILLTIMLKVIESLTLYRVYTLLLNIDYIPLINQFAFPEIIEVLFHLIVSIVLSICLYFLITYLKMNSRKKIIYLCTGFCIFIGAALFPTTTFSDRTPELTSLPSLYYWLVGHALYGYSFGFLLAGWITKQQNT